MSMYIAKVAGEKKEVIKTTPSPAAKKKETKKKEKSDGN